MFTTYDCPLAVIVPHINAKTNPNPKLKPNLNPKYTII